MVIPSPTMLIPSLFCIRTLKVALPYFSPRNAHYFKMHFKNLINNASFPVNSKHEAPINILVFVRLSPQV